MKNKNRKNMVSSSLRKGRVEGGKPAGLISDLFGESDELLPTKTK
jgi:hypothetical protein